MDEREKLRQHFLPLAPDEQVHGWNAMWEKQITPWDHKEPNPALLEALENKRYLTESPFKDVGGKKVRKKVLVPGCGTGYDVLLFASYGYDAYGLDASTIAIQKAEKHLQDQSQEQKYKLQSIQNGRGEAHFFQADFFKDEFLSQTHAAESQEKTFDLIFDYTFLCALPPPLRPQWAARMSQLLSPTGRLITLQFPLGKPPSAGGPPHGLTQHLYTQLFDHPGREVRYNPDGFVVEDRSLHQADNALVEIESWSPKKVLDPQKGSIMVAVWRHI